MKLSRFLCNKLSGINELSIEDKIQIRNLIIDYFASAYAGYKQNRNFSDKVGKVVFSQSGQSESSVLVSDEMLPAGLAAFMNSLYGHGAELDDGNKMAMGHVGVHVIPAVLALAEAEGRTEKEVLIAIAVGYEAYIRISSAAQPGMVQRSFHSTGMAGALASAVACAKLLGLDAEKIESAMSLACTMSSGLLTYSESQQMIKPLNPAKAAETGIFAARLAREGVIGPKECLEGPNGWFNATTTSVDESKITENYNHLLIHDCYFKLYPSCRHTHCGIEAALKISHRITLENIECISVYIYPNAIRLAGQIMYPRDSDETKFSIHYTLACALVYGEYSVDYMNPPRLNQKVKNIINRIKLIPDARMENRDKGIRGTQMVILLKDGTFIEETILVPKGDPENPLTHEDIVNKLRLCSNDILNNSSFERLVMYLENFGGENIINTSVMFNKGDKYEKN